MLHTRFMDSFDFIILLIGTVYVDMGGSVVG